MDFTSETYPIIKEAYLNKQPIEFDVPLEITPFSKDNVPTEWTPYPPCVHTSENYNELFAKLGTDARDSLSRIELNVQLGGGQIFYKANNNQVSIKIAWPT